VPLVLIVFGLHAVLYTTGFWQVDGLDEWWESGVQSD
jgi:hypothetical protein